MTTPHMNRQPQGIPVGGQFASTAHTEPQGVNLSPAAGTDINELDARGTELYEEVERARDHFSDVFLAMQHVELKTLGVGLKQNYPDARYLVLEDDPEGGGYWINSMVDANGSVIPPKSDFFEEESLLDDDGPAVGSVIADLDRRSVRWMQGVTDDDGDAASMGQAPEYVRIDLDRASALELPEQKTRLDASLIGDSTRDAVNDAVDLAIEALTDELANKNTDYDDEERTALEARLDALVQLKQP
ncbi:hypothetical protein [Arthrobacter sp. zg-Y1110]|uniref:hypothetical protein n=1 Tax=Arthrobacter sp. zg-Y1110 TaxID=2886932 RepID=UPI001D145B64|nr:hypothetical protein [Arthrobacter sp. zg-Y1110]MCC3292614.1 hypothetical protein [Arthrobacter sp. zg-Y1110]UWX86955.1 hypothetical protein N2K99_16515 [Arthrobacter sp. zg-Y1110]